MVGSPRRDAQRDMSLCRRARAGRTATARGRTRWGRAGRAWSWVRGCRGLRVWRGADRTKSPATLGERPRARPLMDRGRGGVVGARPGVREHEVDDRCPRGLGDGDLPAWGPQRADHSRRVDRRGRRDSVKLSPALTSAGRRSAAWGTARRGAGKRSMPTPVVARRRAREHDRAPLDKCLELVARWAASR